VPCTAENQRFDDKYTAAQNANADWQNAIRLAEAADLAVAGACGLAIATLGGATGAGCATAIAALARNMQ
jgi:hypothetical protein